MTAGNASWLCVFLTLPIVCAQPSGSKEAKMDNMQERAKLASEAQNTFGLKLVAHVAVSTSIYGCRRSHLISAPASSGRSA